MMLGGTAICHPGVTVDEISSKDLKHAILERSGTKNATPTFVATHTARQATQPKHHRSSPHARPWTRVRVVESV